MKVSDRPSMFGRPKNDPRVARTKEDRCRRHERAENERVQADGVHETFRDRIIHHVFMSSPHLQLERRSIPSVLSRMQSGLIRRTENFDNIT
jgi:hypothetical protein